MITASSRARHAVVIGAGIAGLAGLAAAREDATMFRDLARVTNLLAHPATFVRPRHLARILRSRLRTTSHRFGAHPKASRRNGASGPPAPRG